MIAWSRSGILGLSALVASYAPNVVSGQATTLGPRIAIDRPTRVSPPGAGGHFFGFGNTKADPEDPSHLITCGIRQEPSSNSWQGYLYATYDGGDHWREAFLDSSLARDSSPGLVSEVSCAMGTHGNTYFTTSTWDPIYMWSRGDGWGVFRMYHSSDGERTWSPPATHSFFDSSRSAVDDSDGPYRGRLYVFGDDLVLPGGLSEQFDGIPSSDTSPEDMAGGKPRSISTKPLLVSEDGGTSILGPVFPPSVASGERYGGARLHTTRPDEAVILRDGTALVVYVSEYQLAPQPTTAHSANTQAPYAVEVMATKDGGHTLIEPATVTKFARRPYPGHATIAIDQARNSDRDRVYVSWDEGTPSVRSKGSVIQIAWSDDSGATWSPPTRVDDAPPAGSTFLGRGGDPEQPSLAINRKGVIGITWVEQNGMCWRFAASTDGGKHFEQSIPLNSCPRKSGSVAAAWRAQINGIPYPWREGIGADVDQLGLTISPIDWRTGEGALAATADGVFHPTWTLRYTTGELWTTRVVVEEKRAEVTSVAGLISITEKLVLEIRSVDFDETVNEVSADVRLINRGRQPLAGPFVLRVKALRSDFGSIELVNSNGGGHNIGALVEFTARPFGDVGTEQLLRPNERSAPRRLVFHLQSAKRPTLNTKPNFVSMAADVYGH
jgi:hypothetical protein